MAVKFSERCYQILKEVPKGKVTTYKILANVLGTKAYRAVGSAMKNNPYAPRVPCHRVIKSNGEIGEYAFGVQKKIALLEKEGIEIKNNKIDLNRFLYTFS